VINTIFFNLWGNGGAHWTSKYKKFVQEEDVQWTTVQHKKSKLMFNSYATAVKGLGVLTGANKILIGDLQFRIPLPNNRSWHEKPPNGSSSQISVFRHITWPRMHNQGSGLSSSPNSFTSDLSFQFFCIGRGKNGFQNLNCHKPLIKVKCPWIRSLVRIRNGYVQYVPTTGLLSATHGVSVVTIQVRAHCTTHWRRTGRKVQFQRTVFGNLNNSNEASYSKNPFNLSLIDNLLTAAPLPSSLDTLLHIGLYQGNSQGFHSLEISH
jgi:hypothetical protein